MNNPYIARVLDFNVNNKIDYSVKKRPAPSLAIELKPNLDASGITIVADENGEPIALDEGYGRPIPLDDSPIQSSKKRKIPIGEMSFGSLVNSYDTRHHQHIIRRLQTMFIDKILIGI